MLVGHGITKSFGGVRALDDVNIEIESGQLVGLLGPNGSGKTTLVNVLTGYTKPSSGSVWLDGVDVTRWPAHRRATGGIGRSYQLPRLFSSLTVRANVETALSFARAQPRVWRGITHIGERAGRTRRRAEADQLLRQVDMLAVADRMGSSLSVGEARRAAIARALGAAGKVLILDEPAAGLRGAEAAQIGEIAARIAHESNKAVLLIEHNVALVRAFCDRLTVLNFGRVIAEGSPDDVVGQPEVIEAYIGRAEDIHA
jgi:ABC-type branched-subunit amino acid transport system ATPase component